MALAQCHETHPFGKSNRQNLPSVADTVSNQDSLDLIERDLIIPAIVAVG